MASYTTNLNLKLPNGSAYWNLDTWVNNMRILDNAVLDIKNTIQLRLHAQHTIFDNTDSRLSSTNAQDAVSEIIQESCHYREITVTQDMSIEVQCYAHDYIVLTIGNTVYNVTFTKSDPNSQNNFQWLGNQPTFEANKTYEISFLKLVALWKERA